MPSSSLVVYQLYVLYFTKGNRSHTIDSVMRGMGDHAVGRVWVAGMGNIGGRTLLENCLVDGETLYAIFCMLLQHVLRIDVVGPIIDGKMKLEKALGKVIYEHFKSSGTSSLCNYNACTTHLMKVNGLISLANKSFSSYNGRLLCALRHRAAFSTVYTPLQPSQVQVKVGLNGFVSLEYVLPSLNGQH